MPVGSWLVRFAMVAAAVLAVGQRQTCQFVSEVRLVDKFTGVHASNGITVHAKVDADANTSLLLKANAGLLPQVQSTVDARGTLILQLATGEISPCVQAEIVLPEALTYAGASTGAEVIADAAAGMLSATLTGEVVVGTLNCSEPVAIVSETRGEITVATGKVGLLAVSCNSRSTISLGTLEAEEALVTASYKSSISGLTAGHVHVSATEDTIIALTVSHAVTVVCSTSMVDIDGAAVVTTYLAYRCVID